MEKTFTPDHYKLTYILDDVKKTFRQYKLHSADIPELLPELVRTQKNNGYNSITGAENLLIIRNANTWTKCTLTGLRPTETPNFYYSDLPVNGVKSLIVIFVPNNSETVVLRVCKQFYPHLATDRQRIINLITQKF